MKSRVVSIVIALILCLCNVAFADESVKTVSNEEDVLASLNIYPGDTVNSESFIYALLGFIYDEPRDYGSAEELARARGIISSTEYFEPKSSVSFNDGVRYAVKLLGYYYEAEQKGGTDDAYRMIASRLGITKGISNSTKRITKNIACSMLYQMLDVEPAIYNISKKEYAVEKNTTLIGLMRNIGTVKGIVTADKQTSIYEKDGVREGYIEIGETEYYFDGETDDLLGKNVKAYVKYDDDVSKVIYIAQDDSKNDEIIIDAEDILKIYPDFTKIDYESGNKTKTLKLATVPRVIYNGKYYGQYSVEDLKPDIGNIRLVDNDQDKKYDIIFISDYKTIVISKLDTRKSALYNEYGFESAIKVMELEDNYESYKLYKGGNEISFSDLKAGDILSVLDSMGEDDKIADIFVSENAPVTGKITQIDYEDLTLKINGNQYKMSEDFNKYIKHEGIEIRVDREYTFSFDYMGNIAYIENDIPQDEFYLLLRAYDIEGEDSYYVTCLDAENEWHDMSISEKVYVDDKRYQAEEAYRQLLGLEPQLVKLKTNSIGEIKRIELPVSSSSYQKDKFTKTPFTSLLYRKNPKSFNMVWYLEDDAKTFVFPQDTSSRDRNDYYVVATAEYFTVEKNYDVSMYDVDKFGFSRLVAVKEESPSAGNTLVIVTGIQEGLVDGVVYPCIKGATVSYPKIMIPVGDKSLLDGISKGDVITVSLGRDGLVNVIERVCSLTQFTHSDPGTYYNTGTKSIMVVGEVTDEDIKNKKILIDCNPENAEGATVPLKLGNVNDMVEYDLGRNVCNQCSVANLKKGDKIVVTLSSGLIYDIIRVIK